MKKLAEFALADGSTILAEVDSELVPTTVSGATLRGATGEVVERAAISFDDAILKVRSAAEAIITRLRDIAEPPDTIEVEFGLKLSSSVGAIIASGSGEAHFDVKLSWKRAAASAATGR